VTAEARAWIRRIVSFAIGLGLFIVMIALWGQEGANIGRMVVAAVLIVGFVSLLALWLVARRRRTGSPGAGAIAKLLRAGRIDEAVRRGRELFEQSPADPHVAWYYTAALMTSGHLAEARRVFASLKRETLPPKMAAMHDEVKQALEKKTQGS
jgi:hypothetical protein